MNHNRRLVAVEDGYPTHGRHLVVRSRSSLDQCKPVLNTRDTSISINAQSTDVETGYYWDSLDTDGMGRGLDEQAKEKIILLTRLEKEKEELRRMAIKAWAMDVYLKRGGFVSGS